MQRQEAFSVLLHVNSENRNELINLYSTLLKELQELPHQKTAIITRNMWGWFMLSPGCRFMLSPGCNWNFFS